MEVTMEDHKTWETPSLTKFGSVQELTTYHGGDTNKHKGFDDGFTYSEGQTPIGVS